MKKLPLFAAALLLIGTTAVNAVEPLTATTLQRYCADYADDPESLLSQKCVAYVGGFLDGAVATDERVAENVVSEIEATESFAERAIRTRVYGRLREYGPSVYAEFCVGQPVPIKEVVLHVNEELSSRESVVDISALSIVYAALRKHYSCKQAQ